MIKAAFKRKLQLGAGLQFHRVVHDHGGEHGRQAGTALEQQLRAYL